MRIFTFVLLISGLARCVDHNILNCESPNPLLFNDSTRFEIPFHCTISNGENKSIRFASVNEDSRCPVDARCIWEGKIDVTLEVLEGENVIATFNLNFAEYEKQIELDGKKFSVVLARVDPARRSNKEIKEHEYQLTLIVKPFPG
jgi:hypothetical protein